MLNTLSLRHDLILLLPLSLIRIIQEEIDGEFNYRQLKYFSTKKGVLQETGTILESDSFGERSDKILHKILAFTYGSSRPNLSQHFLTRQFLLSCKGGERLFAGKAIILAAQLASQFRLFRFLLQRLGMVLNTPNVHQDIFDEYHPSAVVVCSLGISLDAFIMREAKKNRVPVMSIVQSWDKTSSKGYPVVTPDQVVVWSDIMAEEVEHYHDVNKANILIGGVPQWDCYFNGQHDMSRERFFERYQLAPNRKIIYFGLCSMAYHQGNLGAIDVLIKAFEQNQFMVPVQIIFRPHPAYYGALEEDFKDQFAELLEVMLKYENHPYLRFLQPNIENVGTAYISSSDNLALHEILAFSDVCVTVLSTQMIEAAILDLPIVTLEYGGWKTSEIDADLSELKLEHIERIFRTQAISRSKSSGELLENINGYLLDPDKKLLERRALAKQEVPLHHGSAGQEVARLISRFVSLTKTSCLNTFCEKNI